MTALPEFIRPCSYDHTIKCDLQRYYEALAIAWEALEKGSYAHEAKEPDLGNDNFWKDLAKYEGARMLKAMHLISEMGR